MIKRLLVILFLLSLPFAVSAQEAAEQPIKCKNHLFSISKSDNKNMLYYDIKLKADKIDNKNPVDLYWIMYAEKDQREGLTLLEKPQFGINTKEVEKGVKYIINVKNSILKKRDIIVTLKSDGCAEAITKINGKDAVLETIYVFIKSKTAGIPNVSYVDITGKSVEDGSELTERVNAK